MGSLPIFLILITKNLGEIMNFHNLHPSSFYPVKFSESNPNLMEDWIPVDNCSVDNPAYNVDMVKIHHICEGNPGKCSHEIKQKMPEILVPKFKCKRKLYQYCINKILSLLQVIR